MITTTIASTLFKSLILKIIDTLHMLHRRYFLKSFPGTLPWPYNLAKVQSIRVVIPCWSRVLTNLLFSHLFVCFYEWNYIPSSKAYIQLLWISEWCLYYLCTFTSRTNSQGFRWHQDGWPGTGVRLFQNYCPLSFPTGCTHFFIISKKFKV